MNKIFKVLSIAFVLVLGSFLFVGCGNDNSDNDNTTYQITFMRAYHVSEVYDSDELRCLYIKDISVEVEEGSVIGPVSADTEYGDGSLYRFVGWYTEEECINQWNLYADIVRSNLTLYPKYEKI